MGQRFGKRLEERFTDKRKYFKTGENTLCKKCGQKQNDGLLLR
jgi:hypothetical protein